jgi:hypothetical protein
MLANARDGGPQESDNSCCVAGFEVGQHAGVDVLPRHFYSQIPNIEELRKSTVWKRPRDMSSVPGHALAQQLKFAERICDRDIVAAAIRDHRAVSARRASWDCLSSSGVTARCGSIED